MAAGDKKVLIPSDAIVPALGLAIPSDGANGGPAVLVGSTNPLPTAGTATEVHLGQVGSPGTKLTVTPTVETTALDAGDVVFGTTEIANCVRVSGGFALLQDLIVVDTADQKAQLTLVFLQANTALGTLDAAPDIDDTEVLDVIGTVAVAAADYVDLGGASVATIKGIGLMLKPTTGTSVWVGAFTSGTPTYTAADALRLRFGVLQG